MRYMLIALLCFLPSTLMAEAVATIKGPTEGRQGDLIVLDGAESVGDGFRWISPEGIQTLNCGNGGPGQLAFASGKAAKFTFTLIAADKEANIDFVTHTVTIGTPAPVPDPNPPDDPTPVPSLDALRDLAKERAMGLSDKETAKGLAQAILAVDAKAEELCSTGQCPGLAQLKAMMVAAIEQRLQQRKGSSLLVNWLDGWRKPVNDAIVKLNIVDVPTYRAAMRAVAVGLDSWD